MLRISPLNRWIAHQVGSSDPLKPEILEAYQLMRLRQVVAYAKKHSSFYAERLRFVRPDDLCRRSALQALPFTTEDDLRQQGNRFLCVSQQKVARVITLATSGTSGEAKRLFFSEHDQALCVDFFASGMLTMVDPGQTVSIFLGGLSPGGTVDLLLQALRQNGIEGVVGGFLTDAVMHDEQSALFAADCFIGLPVQIMQLAKKQPCLRPRSVLLCSDYIADSIRQSIQALWGCEVFTHYGSTECGLGGGVECAAHSGFHLRDADLLFEIIDPANGTPVPFGVCGEVVFSTLSREAMPFIRYRTGDKACLIKTPCPCGSLLPRLSKISGRYCNSILLGSGKSISIHDLDELLFQYPQVFDFKAVLHPYNEMHLYVQPCAPLPAHLPETLSLFFQDRLKIILHQVYEPLQHTHSKRKIDLVQ